MVVVVAAAVVVDVDDFVDIAVAAVVVTIGASGLSAPIS